MKNQYFGDKRDFFKFDLVLTLIEHLKPKRRFTYVPMLTKDEGITDYPEKRKERERLYEFLMKHVEDSKKARNIAHLRSLMEENNVEYLPCPNDKDFFSSAKRENYFREIKPSMLQNAVILVDPDTGFEPDKPTAKHLKYSEFAALYEKLDGLSLLLSIQFFRRGERRDKTISEVKKRICEELKTEEALCVHDNQVAFFIVAKTSALLRDAQGVLKQHRPEYKEFPFQDENIR